VGAIIFYNKQWIAAIWVVCGSGLLLIVRDAVCFF